MVIIIIIAKQINKNLHCLCCSCLRTLQNRFTRISIRNNAIRNWRLGGEELGQKGASRLPSRPDNQHRTDGLRHFVFAAPAGGPATAGRGKRRQPSPGAEDLPVSAGLSPAVVPPVPDRHPCRPIQSRSSLLTANLSSRTRVVPGVMVVALPIRAGSPAWGTAR